MEKVEKNLPARLVALHWIYGMIVVVVVAVHPWVVNKTKRKKRKRKRTEVTC